MELAIVGPLFFGYLADLAEKMVVQGTPTTFYDERMSNSIGQKIFVRFAPQSLKDQAMKHHLDQLVDRIIAAGTTHVLLVSVEVVTPAAVDRLKAAGIEVHLYLFDAISNKAAARLLLDKVARVASFDPRDCAVHDFFSIPLFSAAPYDASAPKKTHDVFYCTTLHSNRPALLTDLRAAMAKGGWSANLMLFYHSRLLWLVRYAFRPQVWPLLKLLSTQPFSQTQIAAATQRARVVIDIHHGEQSGLTMRTFEALSLDTVLLTTNPYACKELPEALQPRLVSLDRDDLYGSLDQALQVANKLTPLAAEDQYLLSVDRFIQQILALVSGADIPDAFDHHAYNLD